MADKDDNIRNDDDPKVDKAAKDDDLGGIEIIDEAEERAKRADDAEPRDQSLRDDADEEAEKRRQRNRERASERKERRREAQDRDKRRIQELEQRLAQLETGYQTVSTRQAQTDRATLAATLRSTETTLQDTLARRAKAFEDGDHVAVNQYDEDVYLLRRQRDDLKAAAEKQTDRQERTQAQPGRVEFTPADRRAITRFLEDHDWIDPSGRDDDSKEALAIDREMLQDGYRPSDPDWPEELARRLQEALPHRFDQDDGSRSRRPERRGPPTGGRGRESGAGGGTQRQQFRLTPELKQMLDDAGHEPGSASYNRIIRTWHQQGVTS